MKLIAVDDHPLMQQALLRALPELDRSLEVIVAEDRDSALTALALHPDCALGAARPRAARHARPRSSSPSCVRDHPRLPIVVLSATHDRATVDAALAAGARGYVAKTADARDARRRDPARRWRGGRGHQAHRARAPTRRAASRRGARPHRSARPTCCGSSCRASPTS